MKIHISIFVLVLFSPFCFANQEIEQLKSVTVKNPNDLNARFQLGYALYKNAQYDEALRSIDMVLARVPNHTSVLEVKAACYKESGDVAAMIDICKKIISLDFKHSTAHTMLADAYRLQGLFQEGWREYLHRFQHGGTRYLFDLSCVKGKRVAIHVEGKIGDNIQFLRYAKLFKELGATVIVQANKLLFPLFKLCDYVDEVVSEPIPPHDLLTWQQNLPLIFNTTVDTVPTPIPYLHADPLRVEFWRSKMSTDRNFSIGICWQSGPDLYLEQKPLTRRSIPLSIMCRLAEIPGVSVYSLQQVDGLDQLKDVPRHIKIHTFDNIDKEPFMDTAAIMQHLDLIVTVDTSVAHLAGAMGIPVWVLLPSVCEWRWMLERSDSPWYPSMRLFRKNPHGDWNDVIECVAEEIKQLLH